jgi:hypothetical protein
LAKNGQLTYKFSAKTSVLALYLHYLHSIDSIVTVLELYLHYKIVNVTLEYCYNIQFTSENI